MPLAKTTQQKSHLPTLNVVSRNLKIHGYQNNSNNTATTTATATSNNEQHNDLWALILNHVEEKFELAWEGDVKRDQHSLVDRSWVRSRVSAMVGVTFQNKTMEQLQRPIRMKDFVCLRSKTKELSLVSRGVGSALLRKAVALLHGLDLNLENEFSNRSMDEDNIITDRKIHTARYIN